MRNHSGDLYEPFCGSGSGLIAAHRLGRRCFALDVEPRYVDVICARYQAFTGDKPVLEATGEPVDFSAGSATHAPEAAPAAP